MIETAAFYARWGVARGRCARMRWWWLFAPAAASACGLLLPDDELSGHGGVVAADDLADAGDLGDARDAGDAADCEAIAVEASVNDRAEGSPEDGNGADRTPASDAVGPCTNLLLNAGFEDKASCDPWVSALDDGSIAVSSTANSGARACEMCGDTQGLNFFTALHNTAWSPGETLVFSGWVRATDDKLYAVGTIPTVGDNVNQQQLTVLLSNDYQHFSMELTYPEDAGPIVTPYIRWIGGGNGCMLVDDLSVCRRVADAGGE